MAFIFAILIGLIASATLWVSIYSAGDRYKGVIFSESSDDVIYLARIQEILDGHGLVGSPYFYEYKSAKALMLPYGEYFYALPSIIFHIPVAYVLAISVFLFPAILFFLVYLLIHYLTYDQDSISNKMNAIAGGSFVMVANYLLMYDFMRAYLTGQIDVSYSILWTRTVNPVTGGLLLMAFLLLLWSIINKKCFYFFIPAGIILGLMTAYFFSWSCALAVTGALIAIFLFKKEYATVKSLIFLTAVSLLTSVPFLYNGFSQATEANKVLYTRMGMSFTHSPVFNKITIVSLSIFTIFLIYEFYQKKKIGARMDNWWWFSFALLAGGVLAYNQQIITGRLLSIRHFPQYTIPLAIIAGLSLLYNQIKPKLKSLWFVVVSLMTIVSVALSVSFAIKNYQYTFKDFLEAQKDADIFSWFNENAPKDCVVLPVGASAQPRDMALFIPAFTHCNVYQFYGWNLSGAPMERSIFGYLVYLRARGVTDKTIDDYLKTHQEEIRVIYSESEEQVTGEETNEPLMKKATESVAAKYNEFFKLDFVSELKKYRLDYVLIDEELSGQIVKIIPGLKYINKLGGWELYQF